MPNSGGYALRDIMSLRPKKENPTDVTVVYLRAMPANHVAHIRAAQGHGAQGPLGAREGFGGATKRLGPGAEGKHVEENTSIVMARFDTDHNGIIDRDELTVGMQRGAAEEAERASGKFLVADFEDTDWFELHDSPKPLKQVLLGLAIMCVFDFGVAIGTGFYLNHELCGNVLACDASLDPRFTPEKLTSNMLNDGYVNFLHSPCKTAAVAVSLYSVTMFMKLRAHPRLYGIYCFWMFIALATSVTVFIYSARFTASSATTSTQQVIQIRNVLEDDWEPGASWETIKSAGMLYSWLAGPMKQLLFAGDSNAGCGARARRHPNPETDPQDVAPMCNDVDKIQGQGTWFIIGCYLRQNRVKAIPVQGTPMENSEMFPVKHIYPEFSAENQDTTTRTWVTSDNVTVNEGYLHDKGLNAFLKSNPDTPIFPGSRLIGSSYTGQSGQYFGGDCDSINHDNPLRDRSCMTYKYQDNTFWPGWWHGFNSTEPNGGKFDKDLARMKEGWWIDEQTRMVQLGCRGANTNTNQNFLAFYTVEFGASGLVNPMDPVFSAEVLNRDISLIWGPVNPFLLYAFYYVNAEIFEFGVSHSFSHYFIASGWLNLLEWFCLVMGYISYISLGHILVVMPEMYDDPYAARVPHRIGHWSQMQAQNQFALCLGLMGFAMWFKLLCFTKNVPLMSMIGNTFGGIVFELIAFCLVMFVLCAAFAMFFNIVILNGSRTFATFADAMMAVSIDGLMGNMDTDPIVRALPTFGPLFYAAYLFSILFVGFTILISIISDSCEPPPPHVPNYSIPLYDSV